MVNFVFVTFGDNLNNYLMGSLSLLSIMKNATTKNYKIVIYTDKPHFYNWCQELASQYLEIRELSQDTIKEWRGPHDFLWRMKIMTIFDCAKRDKGHVIYMDGDTYVYKSLDGIIDSLDNGLCYMHLKEDVIGRIRPKASRKMWSQIRNKTIAGYKMENHLNMWNAGVIVLPENQKIELMDRVLKLSDAICDLVDERYMVEQFSFSVVLETTGKLRECDDCIKHYWGNKSEWSTHLHQYFSKLYQTKESLTDTILQLDNNFWTSIPIKRYRRTMARRFDKIFQKCFQDRITY